MPDLLLELFSEEIPARMQRKAAEDLRRLVTDALVERGFQPGQHGLGLAGMDEDVARVFRVGGRQLRGTFGQCRAQGFRGGGRNRTEHDTRRGDQHGERALAVAGAEPRNDPGHLAGARRIGQVERDVIERGWRDGGRLGADFGAQAHLVQHGGKLSRQRLLDIADQEGGRAIDGPHRLLDRKAQAVSDGDHDRRASASD